MIIADHDHPPVRDEKRHGGPAVPPKDPRAANEQRGPNLDELPPPYTPPAGRSSAPQAPLTGGPAQCSTSATSSIFRPQNAQTVNNFELFSRHDAISGTYLVDPLLPSPLAAHLRKKRGKKRARKWGKGALPADINASFRTRHGALSLDLAVVSDSGVEPPLPPGGQKPSACIVASSRHGRINLNLFEVQPSRRVDLEVESRHGKIVILLPPTYDGPLLFQTRNLGAVSFLPAFAARTRTLHATERETLVVCTAPDAPERPKPPHAGPPGSDDGDRVLVRTRHGRVIIGISGLDHVEEPPNGGGLFKRLGDLIELGGRALGQYVEQHAATLEKRLTNQHMLKIERKLTERGLLLGQLGDTKGPDTTAPTVGRV
ncbi:hypothetical protein BC628DRAFT_1351355 [Trametes gibbosa]|nr:hypothetical protein BC628DRAFT_1351355 [Trametes gibbosa]